MSDRQFPIENVQRAIRRLLDQSGSKPKPLSTALGLGPTAVRDVLLPKAKGVSTATLKIIADHFGVSVDDMLAGTASISGVQGGLAKPSDHQPIRSADAGETAQLMRLDLSLPMGPGATVDDYIEEEPVEFDLGYLRAITRTPVHRLRLARGVGDSMFPTLQTSDEVLLDTTQNQLLHSDRIYAASINGGAAIKRLRPIEGGKRILVISDNKTIDPYPVDAREVLIWGRVIRFARDL